MKIAIDMGLDDYYAHGEARGIVRYARARGDWQLYGRGWMFSSLEDLSRWEGDGVIARIETREEAETFRRLSVPVVDVANAYHDRSVFRAVNDDRETGRRAGLHLASRGFRRFAFAGVSEVVWSALRLEGFREAAGVEPALFLQSLSWYKSDAGDEELRRFLSRLDARTALFACNSAAALKAANACRKEGIAVPGEVALLGVDNEDIPCELARPPLSSVGLQLEEIGYIAAAMLHARLDGRPVEPARAVPPGEIIERESTRIFAFADPLVSEAMRLIRTEAARAGSIAVLARALNVSRRSLELRFKRETGSTPHEELVRSRIDISCGLLRDGDATIESIAAAAGFSSAQRFYAVFKERTGLTPGAYREEAGMRNSSDMREFG